MFDGENQQLIDKVIYNILNYLIMVEFNDNGEYYTLTITGNDVHFYTDRVEVNGEVIATITCADGFVGGTIPVTAIYTSKG